jgi:ribosomal protein S14
LQKLQEFRSSGVQEFRSTTRTARVKIEKKMALGRRRCFREVAGVAGVAGVQKLQECLSA